MILINASPYIPPLPPGPNGDDFESVHVFGATMLVGVGMRTSGLNMIVAGTIGGQRNLLFSSDGGETWSINALPLPTDGVNRQPSALGLSGTRTYIGRISTTGNNTTGNANLQYASNYNSIFSNVTYTMTGGIISIGMSGTTAVFLSGAGLVNGTTDFSSFTGTSNLSPISPTSIMYGNGIYLMLGSNGVCTLNGTAATGWNTTSISGLDLTVAEYADGTWLGGGLSGKLAVSTTGTSWTTKSSPLPDNINSIAYGNGAWGVMTSNQIAFSVDLNSWQVFDVKGSSAYGLCYSNNRFMYVASNQLYALNW